MDYREFLAAEGKHDREVSRLASLEGMQERTALPLGMLVVVVAKKSSLRGKFGQVVGTTDKGWAEVKLEGGRVFTFAPEELVEQED